MHCRPRVCLKTLWLSYMERCAFNREASVEALAINSFTAVGENIHYGMHRGPSLTIIQFTQAATVLCGEQWRRCDFGAGCMLKVCCAVAQVHSSFATRTIPMRATLEKCGCSSCQGTDQSPGRVASGLRSWVL